jgi:hypothetical protein
VRVTVPKPQPPERRRRPLTATATAKFLDALAAGWSVKHAAELTSYHRSRFYDARHADDEFATAWDDAVAAGTQVLEDEALRRAVHGVDEPVFQKGEQVGTIRRYSDNLLMFLLKKRDPSYRENARLEVTGQDGEPIQVEHDSSTLRSLYAKLVDTGLVRAAQPAQVEQERRALPPGEQL